MTYRHAKVVLFAMDYLISYEVLQRHLKDVLGGQAPKFPVSWHAGSERNEFLIQERGTSF